MPLHTSVTTDSEESRSRRTRALTRGPPEAGLGDPSSGDRAPGRLGSAGARRGAGRSEEHTSELQSQSNLVCRLLLEKKKKKQKMETHDEQVHTHQKGM